MSIFLVTLTQHVSCNRNFTAQEVRMAQNLQSDFPPQFNLYYIVESPSQDVDGRIILRWIFRKLEGVVGTGWSWLRIGTDGGHLWVR